MKIAIGIAATLTAMASSVFAQDACPRQPYPIQASQGYEHTKWIESNEAGDIRFDYGGFVASFDGLDDDCQRRSKIAPFSGVKMQHWFG